MEGAWINEHDRFIGRKLEFGSIEEMVKATMVDKFIKSCGDNKVRHDEMCGGS
jgi:hypothetical protein